MSTTKKEMLLHEFAPVCEAVVDNKTVFGPKFPVFDIHTHMGKLLLGEKYETKYDTAEFLETLRAQGVSKICELDGFWGTDFDKMLQKTKGFEDSICHMIWIDPDLIDDPDFAKKTTAHIEDCVKRGAVGIKMWKNLTLSCKDKAGKPIRTDDDRLQCVYETAARLDIPILIHIGDPVAFFKPLTPQNERYEELMENPDWQFFGPEYPSFEELMEMQDRMIEKNPNTKFIVAHVGSYAENLGHVGERLERYPNMYIDIAARIAELGRVPYTARRFFIKYADRILFGSDSTPKSCNVYRTIYTFLETENEYFPYEPEDELPGQGRWAIYGIHLPDDVLRKIYYENACKLLHFNDIGNTKEE